MKKFFLQDSRSDCGTRAQFWATSGGYTTDLRKAETFTLEKAMAQHNSRETDIPLEVNKVLKKSEWRLDIQSFQGEEELDYIPFDGSPMVWIKFYFDGNDVSFVPDTETKTTKDFFKAKIWKHVESLPSSGSLYKYADIVEKIRPTIAAKDISRKSMAYAEGAKLIPLPRKRELSGKTVFNCATCGKFVSAFAHSESTVYCENCKE